MFCITFPLVRYLTLRRYLSCSAYGGYLYSLPLTEHRQLLSGIGGSFETVTMDQDSDAAACFFNQLLACIHFSSS